MDATVKELVAVQKTIVLDANNYGHWKARMKQLIRSVNEDAWTAIEEGWEEPYILNEDGTKVPKPKDRWTEDEKKDSKFNSKALTAIFSAVDLEQFKLIQGSESAKEAWEILMNSFEGDTSVKRTRLDHLATQFEMLRMEETDTVAGFSAKLKQMQHEASVLGKKYKDKKLVKKLLRCLPAKFSAHKAVLKMTANTDEIKFDKVIGMLKAEEMESGDASVEVKKEDGKKERCIALASDLDGGRLQKLEDNVGLLAKNFSKMLKRVEKGNTRTQRNDRFPRNEGDSSNSRNFRSDRDAGRKKGDVQCFECEGFGHMRADCPLTKRKEIKCPECKGMGHTKSECPNGSKSNDKSLLAFSDSDFDDDEVEEMLNLVAFSAKTPAVNDVENAESESDDEEEEIDTKAEYRKLYESWVNLSQENLKLVKEKALLKAKVNILELEQTEEVKTTQDMNETEPDELSKNLSLEKQKREELETQVRTFQTKVAEEKEKSECLFHQLTENRKRVMMLNSSGTHNLEQKLGMGQPNKVNWDLDTREVLTPWE